MNGYQSGQILIISEFNKYKFRGPILRDFELKGEDQGQESESLKS